MIRLCELCICREARRLIKLGGNLFYNIFCIHRHSLCIFLFILGARVNNEKIDDESKVLYRDSFDELGRLKLSSGKKKHVAIVLG